MAVIGTFGSFTAARLGIYNSQAAMNLVGNNISNINTKGYTRQRLDIGSLYNAGAPRYASSYNLNIGYGAIINQVSQLRDPFLDIRYRSENSQLGAAEATLNGLEQISTLLDEVGKGLEGKKEFGVIEAQLEDFATQLNNLLNQVGQDTYDDLVRGSADTLCKLFNSVANGLEEVRTNEIGYLEQAVDAVNSCLTQIRDLNEQIRNHEIYGDNALELRDARNVAIDTLSKYMKIDVTYSMEKIDQYTEVEKLTITLPGTSDPDPTSKNYGKDIKLIDGIYGTQVNLKKIYRENPDYDPTVKKYFDANGDPTDDEFGADGTTPNKQNPKAFPYIDAAGKYTDEAYIDNELNPAYQGRYLDANGNWTDSVSQADRELVKNPIYDSPNDPNYELYTKPYRRYNEATKTYEYFDTKVDDTVTRNWAQQGQYVAKDGGFTNNEADAKTQPVENPNYTPNEHKYLDADGKPTPNATTANIKNQDYVGKYLTADGGSTDSTLSADYVYDDKFLLELDPLKDRRDNYILGGKHGEELMSITKLTDTDTSGALQAIREMLTEEGVFASDADLEGADALSMKGKTDEELAYAELCKDSQANEKKGIPYYQKVLDNLAQLFAKTMNEANVIPLEKADIAYSQGTLSVSTIDPDNPGGSITVNASGFLTADGTGVVTKDGQPLLKDGSNALTPKDLELPENATQEQIDQVNKYMDQLRANGKLTKEYEYYDGGVLFSNRSDGDDPTNITAANISVAHKWALGEVRILRSVEPEYIKPGTEDKDTSTTANDNIAHFVTLMGQQMNFLAQGYGLGTDTDAVSDKPFYKGTFQEMFTNISATLAHDQEVNTALYSNYNLNTLNIDNDRTSVSGVDLNEEAVSIMQYQKSYAAACQLLTTLDSMLDKLINGTL